MSRCRLLILILAMSVAFPACMTAYKKSVGGETEQVFNKIYLTDLNVAWQSVLAALKSSPLDTANRESGFIRTKWIENTAEKNFFDSFGPGKFFLKSQYRVRVRLSQGFYNGVPSVKVSVMKEQMVQKDVLEGWKPVPTDQIQEQTLLYRIGRLIFLQMKLAKLEEDEIESALRD